MTTALCSIAAEYEMPYLNEWIDWHLKLGFDHLIVYCNNWSSQIPECTDRTTFHRIDGNRMQLVSYNDCLMKYSLYFDWIGFIDIDEFVVLKGYRTLEQMFSSHSQHHALSLNWKLFGSNGHKSVTGQDYSVIGRFTRSQHGVNQHVKTFVNCNLCGKEHSKVRFIMDPHHVNVRSHSPEGTIVSGPFNPIGSDGLAYIAHFCTKSRQECIDRRSRPRADNGKPRENPDEFFSAHDCNDTENLDLQNALSF